MIRKLNQNEIKLINEIEAESKECKSLAKLLQTYRKCSNEALRFAMRQMLDKRLLKLIK